MSLINDALKKAQKLQAHQPAETRASAHADGAIPGSRAANARRRHGL